MIASVILLLIFNQWLETQIVVGKNPLAVCYNPINNKVYSASRASGIISIIDGTTNEVVETIFVNNCAEVVYNSLHNKIYCPYGSGTLPDSILVIDGITNQILKKIHIPYPISYINGSLYNTINNKIYFFNFFDNRVTVLDGERDSIIKIIQQGIGNGPVYGCLAFQTNKIYCFNTWDATVSVISSDLDSVIKAIQLNTPRPGGIIYNFKNKKVYVAHIYDPIVTIIDAENDTVIAIVNVGSPSYTGDMCYDTVYNNIYVPTDDIAIINGETNQLIGIIYLLGEAWITFYNPVNKKIYCSYDGWDFNSIVAIIDGRTCRLIDTIPLHRRGAWKPFCLNPRENRVYIPHAWSYQGQPMDSVISVIKDVSSLNEESSSPFEIKYFPNFLKLKFIVLPEYVESVEIYGINGRLVKKYKGRKKEFKVSLSDIKSGIYFIKLKIHTKEYIRKLVIF